MSTLTFRTLRVLAKPWVLVSLVGLIVIGIVETVYGTGAAGFGLGALGSLLGVILLPMATQIGLIAGSLAFGLRVRHIVFGAMRRVGTCTVGRTTLTFRSWPVVLSSEIGPWRTPVIARCWSAGLTSALAGIAVVAAAWWLADGPFGRGFVLAVTPLMLYKLWPRRVPMTTSTGWLLFGLPRMAEPRRTEFRAGAMAARAYDALQVGDIEGASATVDELAAENPDLNTTVSCKITLHEARGEYVQAVAVLLQHISGAEIAQREMSCNLAGLAGLALSAVAADHVPADDMLPVAKKALHDATAMGFPAFELNGTYGLLALVEHDSEEAVRLAALGAENATSPLARADDYATLARAHMAMRDNAAAREALANAEKSAAWWPRVRAVRERLTVT